MVPTGIVMLSLSVETLRSTVTHSPQNAAGLKMLGEASMNFGVARVAALMTVRTESTLIKLQSSSQLFMTMDGFTNMPRLGDGRRMG